MTANSASPPAWSADGSTRIVFFLLGIPLLLLLLAPSFSILERLTWTMFGEQLAQRNTQLAIWVSFYTSLIATVLIVLTGTPIAYLLAEKRSAATRVLEVLIELPTVFPPAVAGIALLLLFGRRGLIGRHLEEMGLGVAFTPAAVVIAQMFVAAPFFIKAAALGFANVNREMVEAAALHGASWLRILFRVILPNAGGALLSGAVLAWARAMGEFGATIIFAGNIAGRTQTMSLAVFLGFETDLDQALALSAILLLTSLLALVAVRVVFARRS